MSGRRTEGVTTATVAMCLICNQPGVHAHWIPRWQMYEVPRPLLCEDGTPKRPRVVATR